MFSTKTGVAALSAVSNLAISLVKLIIGLLIGSVSVFADGVDSGLDVLSGTLAFFVVRASGRPPDERYPYGRARIENIFGLVEATLIILAGVLIVREAVGKLYFGAEPIDADLGMAVMAISIIPKFLVSRQLLRVARQTDSVALEANARNLTADIFRSVGIIVGLLAVKLTGLAALDSIVALAVVALMVRTGWNVARRSLGDLLDRSLPASERKLIAEILQRHAGEIVGFHQVRTRKIGPERHVDLHLLVDSQISVGDAHSLCDHLEEDIRQELGSCSLNIHVEPCPKQCLGCDVGCTHEIHGGRA